MIDRASQPDLVINEAAAPLQTPDRALEVFCEVSQLVTSTAPSDFLKLVPDKACALMSAPVSILWKLDQRAGKFNIIGTAGEVDKQYKKLELPLNYRNVQRLLGHPTAAVLQNVTDSAYYSHRVEAKAQGWVSLLCAPLRVGGDLVGLLDIYTYSQRNFAAWERHLFTSFGCLTADSLQKADFLQESQDKLLGNKRLERLTEMMLKMTEVGRTDDLLWQLLKDSVELVNQSRGCITRTDYKTGDQVILKASEKRLEGHLITHSKM